MMKKQRKYRLPANYMDIVYTPSGKLTFEKNEEGLVVLRVENKGFYNTVAQKLFHKPRFSNISLDKYGTVVWKCLDGKHSVNDIVEKMSAAFPDEQDRMLDRTVHFLRILAVNDYIKKVKKEEV